MRVGPLFVLACLLGANLVHASSDPLTITFAAFDHSAWTDCNDGEGIVFNITPTSAAWDLTVTDARGNAINPANVLVLHSLGVAFVKTSTANPPLTPGTYTLTATAAADDRMAEATATVTYSHYVDTTAPKLLRTGTFGDWRTGPNTSKVDGYWVQPVIVNALTDDDCRAAVPEMRIDGSPASPQFGDGTSLILGVTPQDSQYFVSVDSDGNHTVDIRPHDVAGNIGSWTSVPVALSLRPPTVAISDEGIGGRLPHSVAVECGLYHADARADGVGLQSVAWLIDGQPTDVSGADGELCFGQTGHHAVQATATDDAGRSTTSAPLDVLAVGSGV